MARSAPKRVLAEISPVGIHRQLIAFVAVRQRLRLHFWRWQCGWSVFGFVGLRLQRPAGLQGNALAQAVNGVTGSSPLTLRRVDY